MRVYLDQMFRTELAERLRAAGHDVIRAAEAGQSTADDREILQTAIDQGRVLVTLDQHFGDWAILPLDRHPGVVRLRVHPATTDNVAQLLIPFLASHNPAICRDHLIILSPMAARWIKTAADD